MTFPDLQDFAESSPARAVLDALPVGVTITDPQGGILFYNRQAAEWLDRRPEYLGRDVRACHEQKSTIEKIDQFLAEFRAGRTQSYIYQAVRKDRALRVTISPIFQNGEFWACLQMVDTIKNDQY